MALSLIASYDSDNSDSDDSDDGISVVIHKNPQHAINAAKKAANKNDFGNNDKTNKKKRSIGSVLSASALARARIKAAKTESVLDNVHRPEFDMVKNSSSEETPAAIPLPSTVLTMFDKTEEQEVNGYLQEYKHIVFIIMTLIQHDFLES